MLVEAKVGIAITGGVVRFPTTQTRNGGPVRFPTNNDKGGWNDQSRAQGPGDKPQKRQRRIGNPSSFTPSGKKLCGAFNSVKGCPDERNCPQEALHRCNIITSSDGRVCFATDHGGHQHRSWETSLHTPMGWERLQKILPDGPQSIVEAVGLQLQCAKHLAWLGRGDLLQVTWCRRFPGLVVVVNLWSGFGSALYALLAAGNRVIALTTEHSDDGTEALLCAFPAAVHLRRFEDIQAEMFQPLLRRRSASVVLAGGKSLCHNPTSHQPHQLARLVQDITNLPEVRDASTQVIGWLETISSAPVEVKRKYDELQGAQHFEIAASDFGWVSQNRTLWVNFSSGPLDSGINRLVKLWPVFFSLSSPTGRNTGFRIRFTGPKPIPAQVHIEYGFLLDMDPRAVMEARAPALHSFTEEFLHTLDSEDATFVAKDVLHCWRADGQRFPPQAYEAKNLVWKGSDRPLWRTPSSAERLAICGFPVTASDEVSPRVRGPVEARRNTLIGRGFHLPSIIVLFTIMALEVLGASPVPRTDFPAPKCSWDRLSAWCFLRFSRTDHS